MLAQFRSAYESGAAQFRGAYVAESLPSEIVVHDDFERSSINAALSTVGVDTDSVELITLRARVQTVSTLATNVWLEPYAKVTGVLGKRPRFEIVPYKPGNYQTWRTAMRPHFSYDGINWTPITGVASATRLLWRHGEAFTQDTVYVARSWPRSVTQVGNQIAAIAAAHPTKVVPSAIAQSFTPVNTTTFPAQAFIESELSAKTDELGRPVPSVPIYAFVIDDAAYTGPKNLCVMNAGIHSGEDVGELVMWEFIDYILNDATVGAAIRQHFRILVHPLVNASGRYAGYWRGAPGSDTDPNREWRLTPTHDCVPKVKSAILSWVGGAPVSWAFDFHSTPYGSGSQHLGINANDPPRVEFDALCRAAYPSGSWADYSDRNVPLSDGSTSDTTSGFFIRELHATIPMLSEASDAYGPLSPTIMRPYAEAMVGALAQMQADGWFESAPHELAAASLITTTATGSLTTGIALQGAASAEVSSTADLTVPDGPAPIELAGAASIQASASGDLTTHEAIRLQADAQASVGAQASLTVGAGLRGNAGATVTATADLSGGTPVVTKRRGAGGSPRGYVARIGGRLVYADTLQALKSAIASFEESIPVRAAKKAQRAGKVVVRRLPKVQVVEAPAEDQGATRAAAQAANERIAAEYIAALQAQIAIRAAMEAAERDDMEAITVLEFL